MREGERVAPEEPLEGGDAGSHHGEPYQRQRRLSSSEAGVEEPVVTNNQIISLNLFLSVCMRVQNNVSKSSSVLRAGKGREGL